MHIFKGILTDGRFRVKDVTSKNECLTRLETCDIADIKHELALTRHQLQIEQKVHSTASDYLKDLQTNLAQELVNWTQRTDDSILGKEKEIQVSCIREVKIAIGIGYVVQLLSLTRRDLSPGSPS